MRKPKPPVVPFGTSTAERTEAVMDEVRAKRPRSPYPHHAYWPIKDALEAAEARGYARARPDVIDEARRLLSNAGNDRAAAMIVQMMGGSNGPGRLSGDSVPAVRRRAGRHGRVRVPVVPSLRVLHAPVHHGRRLRPLQSTSQKSR